MPPRTLQALLDKIGEVKPDCSNIDSLPTITLELPPMHAFGRRKLTLPPQLYVAKLKDVEQEEQARGAAWREACGHAFAHALRIISSSSSATDAFNFVVHG